MAKYPLERLIGLRQHRLDEMMDYQNVCQKKVEQTQMAIVKKKQDIEDYAKWKEEEIVRRYQNIMNKRLTSEAYETFKEGLANLEIQVLNLENQLNELQNELRNQQSELETAKQKVKEASNDLNKLDEHKKIWLANARIEEERSEERELEDFHGKKSFY